MKSRLLLLAGSVVALWSGPVSAQSETLGQAIAAAYRDNPQLQAQRAQLRAIDENVVQASAPYRLRSSFEGQVLYQEQLQRELLFDDIITNRNRALGGSLTASQILFNGGRTAAQVSAAEAQVLSARERLREVENFILLEVVDAYVSVRRDQALIDVQRRSVESYERQAAQARAREQGGDLTRTDIAQAEAQLAIVQTQLAQAEANLQRSRARFAAVVGHNPGDLAPEPPLPGVPRSIDDAYEIAADSSPTLWQAILNERASRARISAARAERNPVISADASIGLNNPTAIAFDGDLRRAATASVRLSIPLLTGGVVASRVRQAIATQQEALFTAEATRRGVDVQVQNAWNQAVSSADQVAIGERAGSAAQDALTGVRRGFEEGFRSNFEVLDSEQRLLNAQVILANARYQQYASQANLLAYLGRLDAAVLVEAIIAYDPAANLDRHRGQFDLLQPVTGTLDRLARAEDDSRAAPAVPPAPDPDLRATDTPPPGGPLSSAIPVQADHGADADGGPGI